MRDKILVVVFATILVLIRHLTSMSNYEDGQNIRIDSKVRKEPIQYSDSQRITLKGLNFYLPTYPKIYYGDRLVVEGSVQGKALKKVRLVEHEESKTSIYSIRRKLVCFYQSVLPEPHSSLIAGMTIGSKASIPNDFWESLKSTSTAHVVVASGMNVTLVAVFLLNLSVLVLPRRKALLIALIGVWIYALLSGFDAPIIRAAIMGTIAFWAQAVGRLNFAWRALFVSAFFMLLLIPQWLTDLGFILSFSATASLMIFEARIRKKLKIVPSIFREGLSTSLAAQIFVAPIIFITFGQFSLLSPIVNALVLWTVPAITMIGMAAGIVGLVWFDLGKIILYLTYPLTSWFVFVVNLFS